MAAPHERPAPSRGRAIGLGLLLLALGVEVALWLAVRSTGPGPQAAVLGLVAVALLPVVAVIAFRTWGLIGLRYELSRDGLVIHWAATRQVVPMDQITHLLTGRPYDTPLGGLRWPGDEVGRTVATLDAAADDDTGAGAGRMTRDLLVYATTPPDGQLVIVTPALAYAISPADRQAFIDEFKVRRRLGTVASLEQTTEQPRWARLSLWRDPITLAALGLALALNVLILAWLSWHYPALPSELATQLRFDPAAGAVASAAPRPRAAVWTLPLIGLGVLLGNAVLATVIHTRARLAASLLAVGAGLVQAGIVLVLTRII